jgi:hypothetical protein
MNQALYNKLISMALASGLDPIVVFTTLQAVERDFRAAYIDELDEEETG